MKSVFRNPRLFDLVKKRASDLHCRACRGFEWADRGVIAEGEGEERLNAISSFSTEALFGEDEQLWKTVY